MLETFKQLQDKMELALYSQQTNETNAFQQLQNKIVENKIVFQQYLSKYLTS